jgi:cytoskeletal protein RodZ
VADEELEPGAQAAPAGHGATDGQSQPSIGQYLAQQRKLRGISIQDLCARTKIPRRNIERLESGALDDQLDGFSRGFVRTLAEALGLDADEAVMRLMREPDAGDERAAALERHARRMRLTTIAVVALVVAVLGFATLDWLAGSEEPKATPPADRPVTYRPDVVRSLAGEQEEFAVPEPPPAPAETGPPAPPAP